MHMEPPSAEVLVRVFGASDVGVVRTKNEDSFTIADLTTGEQFPEATPTVVRVSERGVLIAVSDGMGGAMAGEVASSLVIDSIRDFLDGKPAEENFSGAIRVATENAN